MKYFKKSAYFSMIIYVVVVCHNLTPGESIRNLRKFGVSFDRDFGGRVNDVCMKILRTKFNWKNIAAVKKNWKSSDMKCTKSLLLSRAYAPILKYFSSRF